MIESPLTPHGEELLQPFIDLNKFDYNYSLDKLQLTDEEILYISELLQIKFFKLDEIPLLA